MVLITSRIDAIFVSVGVLRTNGAYRDLNARFIPHTYEDNYVNKDISLS